MRLALAQINAVVGDLEGNRDRILGRLARPLPLLRYLILATETHAFSGSLAFFMLIGFYPSGRSSGRSPGRGLRPLHWWGTPPVSARS